MTDLQKKLEAVKPGKTYLAYAKVTEVEGDVIEFFCNSFFVGMYCAVHVNGQVAQQSGDHNNSSFMRSLKKDLMKAEERGATVELGSVMPCKLSMD